MKKEEFDSLHALEVAKYDAAHQKDYSFQGQCKRAFAVWLGIQKAQLCQADSVEQCS
jgi:hypothetical protein